MTITELKDLAEKATPGPWQFKSECEPNNQEGHDWIEAANGFCLLNYHWNEDNDESNIGFQNSDDIFMDRIDTKYIAAANPETVKQLIARIEGLSEALKYYSDENEWMDYKEVCVDGKEVDSHFDGDLGQKAQEALSQYGSEVPLK